MLHIILFLTSTVKVLFALCPSNDSFYNDRDPLPLVQYVDSPPLNQPLNLAALKLVGKNGCRNRDAVYGTKQSNSPSFILKRRAFAFCGTDINATIGVGSSLEVGELGGFSLNGKGSRFSINGHSSMKISKFYLNTSTKDIGRGPLYFTSCVLSNQSMLDADGESEIDIFGNLYISDHSLLKMSGNCMFYFWGLTTLTNSRVLFDYDKPQSLSGSLRSSNFIGGRIDLQKAKMSFLNSRLFHVKTPGTGLNSRTEPSLHVGSGSNLNITRYAPSSVPGKQGIGMLVTGTSITQIGSNSNFSLIDSSLYLTGYGSSTHFTVGDRSSFIMRNDSEFMMESHDSSSSTFTAGTNFSLLMDERSRIKVDSLHEQNARLTIGNNVSITMKGSKLIARGFLSDATLTIEDNVELVISDCGCCRVKESVTMLKGGHYHFKLGQIGIASDDVARFETETGTMECGKLFSCW